MCLDHVVFIQGVEFCHSAKCVVEVVRQVGQLLADPLDLVRLGLTKSLRGSVYFDFAPTGLYFRVQSFLES